MEKLLYVDKNGYFLKNSIKIDPFFVKIFFSKMKTESTKIGAQS